MEICTGRPNDRHLLEQLEQGSNGQKQGEKGENTPLTVFPSCVTLSHLQDSESDQALARLPRPHATQRPLTSIAFGSTASFSFYVLPQ